MRAHVTAAVSARGMDLACALGVVCRMVERCGEFQRGAAAGVSRRPQARRARGTARRRGADRSRAHEYSDRGRAAAAEVAWSPLSPAAPLGVRRVPGRLARQEVLQPAPRLLVAGPERRTER